ncbi:NADH dehydrogenase [ubiquinone] 1 alpha subcomplex assembly factor 2 [Centruroides vittatus]|uniref:NADH dehydrogenase [ubiquinone] 1 alpha subcomplex assembly factor 2 n=1 Tax=Centruroides vittatus TaxID=120091 RepID=UPI00351080D2
MAENGRSILKMIFTNFIRSLRPKNVLSQGKVAGKDQFGNTYYEIPADPSRGKRVPKRWYKPEIDEDWEKEVPIEWEAWLRGRRGDPPTKEEIDKNYQTMMLTKKHAEKLAAEAEEKMGVKQIKAEVKSTKTQEKFKVIEEFESFPGEKYSENQQKK